MLRGVLASADNARVQTKARARRRGARSVVMSGLVDGKKAEEVGRRGRGNVLDRDATQACDFGSDVRHDLRREDGQARSAESLYS